MNESPDPILEYIQCELREKHRCHTIILYGSRARGAETPASDYDVMGVREEEGILRDARLWQGAYLDLFVYPEASIAKPDESLLHIRGGRVLLEKDGTGSRFLEGLDALYHAGPTKLPEDEIGALKTWAEKSLVRIKAGGIEGHFRRAELLPAMLEHYFRIRGMWYRGPKESLRYLKETRPYLYLAFEEALKPDAAVATIEAWVKLANVE